MALFDNLFGSHVNNLQNALSRTTQRHGVLSRNLANVNTPGYKRQDMDFGIELEKATTRNSVGIVGNAISDEFDLSPDTSDLLAELQNRHSGNQIITDTRSNRVDGSSVDLETEVTGMAETELHYSALADMTSQYFTNLKGIIRGTN